MSSKPGIIRPHEGKLEFLARFSDGLLISLALWLAIRSQAEIWTERYSLAAAASLILFYLIGEAQGLYRSWRVEALPREIFRIWSTWALVWPGLLVLAFVTKTSAEYSRAIGLGWGLLAPVLLTVWRSGVRLALQELRQRGRNTRAMAIVGASPLGMSLARTVLVSPWMGMRLVGFFDDRQAHRLEGFRPTYGEVAGDLDALVRQCRAGLIDTVYIALPLRAEPRINELIRRLQDTTASVYLAYDFCGFNLMHARWSSVGPISVMSVVEDPFYGSDGWLKRLEDLIIGSAIVSLIAVPMLIIAIGVRLSSPGPIFFRQRRYGLNGQEIRVLKFRTMTVCEDGPVVTQAQRNDARVTRFGAFLRRTSLDELPQFLQVLTGQMSIVGPRPHAVAHNEQYRQLIQGYMLRHKVKPGITGWAQVNGWRGETDTLEKMQKRVECDLAYIRNWALSWDIKIIWMTIFGSRTSKNAY